MDSDLRIIHLRVDMAVDRNQVEPSVVVEVVERVPPAHHARGGTRDVGEIRDVGKAQLAVVAEELEVLLAEVGDGNGWESTVLIISNRDPHIRQGIAILFEGDARLKTD